MEGSADRALGRWYFKVPRPVRRQPQAARKRTCAQSLTYNPDSTASHFFLAELLLDEGRKDEARAELQKVIDAPLEPRLGARGSGVQGQGHARLQVGKSQRSDA